MRKKFRKASNRRLYESLMSNISKEVKKILRESSYPDIYDPSFDDDPEEFVDDDLDYTEIPVDDEFPEDDEFVDDEYPEDEYPEDEYPEDEEYPEDLEGEFPEDEYDDDYGIEEDDDYGDYDDDIALGENEENIPTDPRDPDYWTTDY